VILKIKAALLLVAILCGSSMKLERAGQVATDELLKQSNE
jgi:hypothetical protein